jgi:hypothetical protein
MQTRTRVENLKPEPRFKPGFGFKIEHSALDRVAEKPIPFFQGGISQGVCDEKSIQ